MSVTKWQLDASHLGIGFAVRHLMIATVRGRFGKAEGSLEVDESQPKSAHVDVTIDVASIDTRQEQRDAHLRSPDFFDAQTFPTIRFVSRGIDGDPHGEFRLIGDLTIRDVTREVVLDVTNEGQGKDPWGNVRVGFSAQGKIDRRDFGLTWNQALETGGIVVGDEVKLSIDAEFYRQAETKPETHLVAA
jgi:polyisoprenoid-binding protein YceI